MNENEWKFREQNKISNHMLQDKSGRYNVLHIFNKQDSFPIETGSVMQCSTMQFIVTLQDLNGLSYKS